MDLVQKPNSSASRLEGDQRIAVSVKSAAQMLEVSQKSVRRLIDGGLLVPCRALRVHRIPVVQIERFISGE